MRDAGVVCVSSHGEPGYHLAVYAPYTAEGKSLIENWCTNKPGMVCDRREPVPNDPLNPGYYYARVSSVWLQSNWKPSLDAKNAIVSWNTCFSATGNGALPSVKEAAGGRWRIGYANTTTGFEGFGVNTTFFSFMNGKNGEGTRRTAGDAYGGGSGYSANVRMSGNPWTTLASAHISSNAWMPLALFPDSGSSAHFGKGWGCVLFDTYLDDTMSAPLAIQQLNGPAVTNIRWVHVGAGKRGIGFNYDRTEGGTIWLRINPQAVISKGVNGGRPLVPRNASWATGWEEWSF